MNDLNWLNDATLTEKEFVKKYFDYIRNRESIIKNKIKAGYFASK